MDVKTTNPQLEADAQKYSLSTEQLQTLGVKAIQAKDNAYCPYSNFRVGCSLLTTTDKVITGVNVENASYPNGVCAERCALAKAVSDGERSFKALAVATDISPPASPCGSCRQCIREFCDLSLPIFMYDVDNKYIVKTLGEPLLANSYFGLFLAATYELWTKRFEDIGK
ncbi:MAG: hypothetical protein MMC33_010171 [Icmadophila ericetorum]|nr:hypothetical protein [Icmadophila ericetorum]